MLLVAGVFVVSLATVQVEEAHADPMLSSWYGPGWRGVKTASGEVFDLNGSQRHQEHARHQ